MIRDDMLIPYGATVKAIMMGNAIPIVDRQKQLDVLNELVTQHKSAEPKSLDVLNDDIFWYYMVVLATYYIVNKA